MKREFDSDDFIRLREAEKKMTQSSLFIIFGIIPIFIFLFPFVPTEAGLATNLQEYEYHIKVGTLVSIPVIIALFWRHYSFKKDFKKAIKHSFEFVLLKKERGPMNDTFFLISKDNKEEVYEQEFNKARIGDQIRIWKSE
ncbi:MAG: hypothetical protein AB8F74_17180, partial [Saprospiraceae bacterium]